MFRYTYIHSYTHIHTHQLKRDYNFEREQGQMYTGRTVGMNVSDGNSMIIF